MKQTIWQTTRFRLSLDRPLVMGIVNVTPDSFSDGGRYADAAAACAHCDALVAEGADILDIGGESTRPGSTTPSPDDELARVLPVLRHAVTLGVAVSVDTSEPQVMRAALDLDVDILNDVRAFARDGAADVAASHPTAGLCLMHMQGTPGTMQVDPHYDDVVTDIARFLRERVDGLRARGVAAERIVVDPGIGFGKTKEHNLELLRRQGDLIEAVGHALLVGWSRKSTLGTMTGRAVGDRLLPSVVAALAAVQQGARIVRVHDVAATRDAFKVWEAAGLMTWQQQVRT